MRLLKTIKYCKTIPLCVILSGAKRSRTRSAMRSIGIYNELCCAPFEIPLRALSMVGFDYENITPWYFLRSGWHERNNLMNNEVASLMNNEKWIIFVDFRFGENQFYRLLIHRYRANPKTRKLVLGNPTAVPLPSQGKANKFVTLMPLSAMKRVSTIGFPLRGGSRLWRVVRCSHYRWRYFFVSFISKPRMLRILHLIRHLTVTPSLTREG